MKGASRIANSIVESIEKILSNKDGVTVGLHLHSRNQCKWAGQDEQVTRQIKQLSALLVIQAIIVWGVTTENLAMQITYPPAAWFEEAEQPINLYEQLIRRSLGDNKELAVVINKSRSKVIITPEIAQQKIK